MFYQTVTSLSPQDIRASLSRFVLLTAGFFAVLGCVFQALDASRRVPRHHVIEAHILPVGSYDLAVASPDEPLVLVVIDTDGTLSLQGQVISSQDLSPRLAQALATVPSDRRIVYVKASRRLLYRQVLDVLRACDRATTAPIVLQVNHLDAP
jgi:hypothetical protein